MAKMIVNDPNGEQQIFEIGVGGEYFDKSLVVWDERVDGAMSAELVVGKIIRNGNDLVELPDYLPEHKSAIEKKQKDIADKQIDPAKMTVKQLTQLLIDRGVI